MAETGNVFVGYHTAYIEIRWLSAQELEISISPHCEVTKKLEDFEGIKLILKTLKD